MNTARIELGTIGFIAQTPNRSPPVNAAASHPFFTTLKTIVIVTLLCQPLP